MPNDLATIAKKYGTDRVGKHNYTPTYERLLTGREKANLTLVELGVAEGAGLKMWAEYLPNAKIYGAEIDQARVDLCNAIDPERIKVFKCNQAVRSDLEALIQKTGRAIDLFIDDGSHVPAEQLFTCLTIMPMLDIKCHYVIEDVADLSICDTLRDYDYDYEEIKCGDRYDDRLVIVTKDG